MIACVMCFKTIEGYPCECGANVQEGAATRAMVKEIQGARPVGITVEEFGMATFEAIQAATARDQARKAAAVYAAKGLARMAHDATLRALAADERLRELLKAETVKGEDVRKILSMADQAR